MFALDRRCLALVTCAALAAVTPSLSAQPRAFPSDSAIRAVLVARVNGGIAPGYAVGLIDSTGATRIITVGTGAGSAPVDAHTLFEIGSITKTFTGTILASMVADRSVRLDQPVAELLPPGTRIPARGARQITLLDLATQSSGLPRMPGNFAPKDPTNPYADYDGARMLSFLASYELTRDPGAAYDYSNLGVGLLGYALAARAKQSYEQLVTKRVLAPLGMRESAVALTPALRARMSTGHDASGAAVPLWDLDAIAGAGALRSSITDMLRYLEANLAADVDPTSAKTHGLGAVLADAHAARYTKGPSGMSLGLAWHRLPGPGGDTIVWHNGGTGGFTSFLGYSAKRKMGVVILANSTSGPDGIAMHWLAGAPLPAATKPRNATRAAITLPPETLDRYVGRFEITPAFSLTVARTGNSLTLTATAQPTLALLAESPTRFFVREVEADLEYEFDAAGNAVSLTLLQQGAKMRGVRK
ncbi:MAG: serine hydrolase [Gemmatimonadaceae bacterium]|nr:serine hydrolase [Gemmatimonadaceae bacterium]